jgi:hypothetical protein
VKGAVPVSGSFRKKISPALHTAGRGIVALKKSKKQEVVSVYGKQ